MANAKLLILATVVMVLTAAYVATVYVRDDATGGRPSGLVNLAYKQTNSVLYADMESAKINLEAIKRTKGQLTQTCAGGACDFAVPVEDGSLTRFLVTSKSDINILVQTDTGFEPADGLDGLEVDGRSGAGALGPYTIGGYTTFRVTGAADGEEVHFSISPGESQVELSMTPSAAVFEVGQDISILVRTSGADPANTVLTVSAVHEGGAVAETTSVAEEDGATVVSWGAQESGFYNVQITAEGIIDGGRFIKSGLLNVFVAKGGRNTQITHGTVRSLEVGDLELVLHIAKDIPIDNGDKLKVTADLWGTHDGLRVPVVRVHAMADVHDHQVAVIAHEQWVLRTGTRAPFEVRNVQMVHVEEESQVTTLEYTHLTDVGVAPIEHTFETMAANQELTLEMQTGRNHAEAYGQPKDMEPQAGTVLLVHGYCSDNIWGPQMSQFASATLFEDFDANRRIDDFAQKVSQQGGSSFGVVAHSQGGMAALHLYTYYWSGLDNGSGNRMIQSVGTPYQGTALGGNMAALGAVFGAGCGYNTDLTYSGATSWLNGIPSWARGKVNYYTTSFNDRAWRYDYCHMVTDVFLDDPDDGTTEKSKAQLAGGINRGHTEGQCHTNDMRDMAQTKDANRNSVMNANAQR